MALTNTQYDMIFRNYENIQLQNRHTLEEHRDEVYELIPEYRDIDSAIANLALEQGKTIDDLKSENERLQADLAAAKEDEIIPDASDDESGDE